VINQLNYALHRGPGRPVNLLHWTRDSMGAGLLRFCQKREATTQLREAVCRESRYWSPKVLVVRIVLRWHQSRECRPLRLHWI
jgi:hypothetical protein